MCISDFILHTIIARSISYMYLYKSMHDYLFSVQKPYTIIIQNSRLHVNHHCPTPKLIYRYSSCWYQLCSSGHVEVQGRW